MDRTDAEAAVDTARGGNTRRARTTPEEARSRNRRSNIPVVAQVVDIHDAARTFADRSVAVDDHTARAKGMLRDAAAAATATAVAEAREVARRRSPPRARFFSLAVRARADAHLKMTARSHRALVAMRDRRLDRIARWRRRRRARARCRPRRPRLLRRLANVRIHRRRAHAWRVGAYRATLRVW